MDTLIITNAEMVFRSGVTERYGSSVYVVDIPEVDVDALRRDKRVLGVYTGIVPVEALQALDGPGLMGVTNWNLRLACEQHRLLEGQVCGTF